MMRPLLAIVFVGISSLLSPRQDSPSDQLRGEIAAARKSGLPVSDRDLQPALPPANENAAPLILKWADLHRSNRPGAGEQELMKLIDFRLSDSAVAPGMKVLADNQDLLSLLHQAVSRPKCVFVKDWSLGPAVLFPELASMRAMARWLAGESGSLARRGRPIDAVKTMALGFRLSHHALSTPTSLHYLVAAAIDAVTLHALEAILVRYRDIPAVPMEVRRTIERDAPAYREQDFLRSQLPVVLNTVDMMRRPESEQRTLLGVPPAAAGEFTIIGVLKGLMGAGEDITSEDLRAAQAIAMKPGVTMADFKRHRIPIVLPVIESQPPRSDAKAYDRWVDENGALAVHAVRRIVSHENTTADRLLDATYDAAAEVQDRLKGYLSRAASTPEASSNALPPSSTSLACLYINDTAGIVRQRRADYDRAHRAILVAATYLFQYRTAHRRFPSHLGMAMSSISRDPFDGKPIRYRLEGAGFVLYSVGRTEKYDGRAEAAGRREARLQFPTPSRGK